MAPIPHGLCVLHRCDVRACVNPSHLFLGTIADNNADMKRKGRDFRGEQKGSANGFSKLTERDVIAIRLDPRSQSVTAADYGVSPAHIGKIRQRVAWRHLE